MSNEPSNERPSVGADRGETERLDHVEFTGVEARPFSRFFHLRQPEFASSENIGAYLEALRNEWDRR